MVTNFKCLANGTNNEQGLGLLFTNNKEEEKRQSVNRKNRDKVSGKTEETCLEKQRKSVWKTETKCLEKQRKNVWKNREKVFGKTETKC